MRASAVLHTAVDTVTFAAVEIPEPGPGEVLIKTLFSCISPGTELRCLAGRQPGPTPWPYIPGYALSGVITACGPDVTLPVGAPVFCAGTRSASHTPMWGGHVSHAVQRAEAVYLLPQNVPLLDASLAKLAAIAYHGVRLSRPLPHETVAVIGLGPIGQLAARLHALAGARVVAADPVASRVAQAERVGIEARLLTGGLRATLGGLLPVGADIVVDATGVPAVLAEACGLARGLPWDDAPTTGARVLIQGSYPADVPLPYQTAFEKELHILVPRDTQPRDMRAVLDLMARGRLVAGDLISTVRPPSDAAEVYAGLQQRPAELMTAAFDWSELRA